MGYRLEERFCRTCGNRTAHWCEQGILATPAGWFAPFVLLSRAFRSALVWRWSCLNCVHPWKGTLLRSANLTPPPTPQDLSQPPPLRPGHTARA